MIVLDTNIVAELMKPQPAQTILHWINEHDAASLYLTAITIGEISYGIRVLPDGKRRQALKDAFARLIANAFEGRVLNFDHNTAFRYGDLMGERKEHGRPLSVADGQIAAIARTNGFAVATRNVRDFEHCELEIINPFDR